MPSSAFCSIILYFVLLVMSFCGKVISYIGKNTKSVTPSGSPYTSTICHLPNSVTSKLSAEL